MLVQIDKDCRLVSCHFQSNITVELVLPRNTLVAEMTLNGDIDTISIICYIFKANMYKCLEGYLLGSVIKKFPRRLFKNTRCSQ